MRIPYKLISVVLLLLLGFTTWISAYSLFAICLVVLLPGFAISSRFHALSHLERFFVSLPLGMLWLFFSVTAISLLQLPVLSRPVLWFIILLPVVWALWHAKLSRPRSRVLGRPAVIAGLLVLFAVSLIISPLKMGYDLPSTDASGYLERAHFVDASLENYGYVSWWYAEAQLGYPIYTFDPPLFYFAYGITKHLLFPHPVLLFNAFIFLFFSLFIMGVFWLASQAFRNDWIAFFIAAFLAINPHLSSLLLYQGNIKLYAAFWLIPIILGLVLRQASAPLIALLLAAQVLAHPMAAAFSLLFMVVVFVLQAWHKPAGCKASSLQGIIAISLLALLLVGFAIPLMAFKTAGLSYTPDQFVLPSAGIFISWLFSEPAPRIFDENFGRWWVLAAFILALVACMRRKFPAGIWRLILSLGITIIAVIVLASFTPVGQLIVTFDRLNPLMLLFAAFAAGAGVWRIARRSRAAAAITIIALLALMGVIYGPVWHDRTDQWVQTNYMSNYMVEKDGSIFKNFTKDRITTYGFFAPNILPPVTVIYGMPTNSYGFAQGQHANIWFTKLVNTSHWGPFRKTTGTYLYNVFLATGTKYIWARKCHPGGQMLIDRFVFACDNCTLKSYLIDSKDPQRACEVVLDLLNATLVEKTTPAVGTQDLYEEIGSYRVTGVSRASAEAMEEDLPLLTPQLIAQAPEPRPLPYERTDEHILIRANMSDAWVLVKEESFPRWSATIDGVPSPIYSTALGFMLLHAVNAKVVELVYRPFWWEVILAWISLVAFVAICLFGEAYLYKRPSA